MLQIFVRVTLLQEWCIGQRCWSHHKSIQTNGLKGATTTEVRSFWRWQICTFSWLVVCFSALAYPKVCSWVSFVDC